MNKTIGKMVLTFIAIFVLFVPVVAIQQIEARSYTHVLEVEGNYVNGLAINNTDLTDLDKEGLETVYTTNFNDTVGSDSAYYYRGSMSNRVIFARDRVSYIGNGSHAVSVNLTELPTFTPVLERVLLISLDLNASDLLEPDFLRIQSDWDIPPTITYVGLGLEGGASYGIIVGASFVSIAPNEWLWINTIGSRSSLQSIIDNCGDQTRIYLTYTSFGASTDSDFTFKVQAETLEGADAFTWSDETLYIMAVVICDILLWGAIIFASDPIDILIDRPGRRKRR